MTSLTAFITYFIIQDKTNLKWAAGYLPHKKADYYQLEPSANNHRLHFNK